MALSARSQQLMRVFESEFPGNSALLTLFAGMLDAVDNPASGPGGTAPTFANVSPLAGAWRAAGSETLLAATTALQAGLAALTGAPAVNFANVSGLTGAWRAAGSETLLAALTALQSAWAGSPALSFANVSALAGAWRAAGSETLLAATTNLQTRLAAVEAGGGGSGALDGGSPSASGSGATDGGTP
jgi:hypothetical protein